jgi:hypothetical protein
MAITQAVTVVAGQDAELNFAMAHAARLAVSPTATGQPERKSFETSSPRSRPTGRRDRAGDERERTAQGGRLVSRSFRYGPDYTSSSIRIRGTSSLSLTNEPPIIVDGVRYDNSNIPGNPRRSA